MIAFAPANESSSASPSTQTNEAASPPEVFSYGAAAPGRWIPLISLMSLFFAGFASTWYAQDQQGNGSIVGAVVGAAALILFLLYFGWLRFWQIGFEIDSNAGILTLRRGPYMPVFQSQHSTAEFVAVKVSTEWVIINRWPRTNYVVLIQSKTKTFKVAEDSNRETMTYLAEDVGLCLGLDVHDSTVRPAVVRKADTLGRTLQETIESDPAAAPAPLTASQLPSLPSDARLQYEVVDHRAIFRLQTGGWVLLAVWLLLAAPAVVFVANVAAANNEQDSPAFWSFALGLPLLYGLLIVLPTRITVEADRQAIRVTTNMLGIQHRREVAANQVREIFEKHKTIHIKSREVTATIACFRLTKDQREWFRGALIKIVAG